MTKAKRSQEAPAKPRVTINAERGELFIISTGLGYSCLGFDVVLDNLRELAARGVATGPILESERGTLAQYDQYQAATEAYARSGDRRTWFNFRTPERIRKLLERCRKDNILVRVFYGDTETGRDWLCEHDTIGRIGRSMGPFKAPLIVPDGECGGPAVLDQHIVKMVDVASGYVLYKHPKYREPELGIRMLDAPIRAADGHSITHGVWAGLTQQAGFSSYAQAAAWVAFMAGVIHQPPK